MPKRPRNADKPSGCLYVLPLGLDLARFERGLYSPDDDVESEVADLGVGRADLEALLDRIPPVEADVIELRLLGCRQPDVAVVVTPEGEPTYSQAAISYMELRGMERLRYLVALDRLGLDGDQVREVGVLVGATDRATEAAVHVWATQSYTAAGEILAVSGGEGWGAHDSQRARTRYLSYATSVHRWRGTDERVDRVRAWAAMFKPGILRTDRREVGWREHAKRPRWMR